MALQVMALMRWMFGLKLQFLQVVPCILRQSLTWVQAILPMAPWHCIVVLVAH